MQAVAYTRVSTEDQRLGPEAQRAAIEAYAAHNGIEIVSWHADEISGSTAAADRPGLTSALVAVRNARPATLLIAKRDRLARDTMVAAMVTHAVERAGGQIVSVDGVGNGNTPAEEFMRAIIDGAAAYERSMIRARTKAALDVKRQRGDKLGGRVPWGYDVCDGKLIPNPAEQAILIRMKELRDSGASLRAIARMFRTRKGTLMGQRMVGKLLQR